MSYLTKITNKDNASQNLSYTLLGRKIVDYYSRSRMAFL